MFVVHPAFLAGSVVFATKQSNL